MKLAQECPSPRLDNPHCLGFSLDINCWSPMLLTLSFDAVEFALEHPDWREQLVRAGCRPALYPAIVKEIEAGISRMRGPLAKESKPD